MSGVAMEQRKILIADDEVEVLEIMEKRLKENGYAVKAVSKGQDALLACKQEKFDMILLDIAMPDMDGYAVASVLAREKITKDIPIIFLTGKELTPEGILDRVEQLGAYDFITKPFIFEDLLAKVKEVIG